MDKIDKVLFVKSFSWLLLLNHNL